MPFIGPKPADTVLDSTLIADGSITSSKIANDGTQSDLYDESFFAKKGLSFTIDNDGNLKVTV